MLYAIIAVALAAVDQLVKFLVRGNITLYTSVPFIPGVMDLTYYQNTGAAFSLLNEHTWILTIISAVVSAALIVVLVKKIFRTRVANVLLAVVLAGAAGNLIDRVLFGFVTDMFQTTFMKFAVFNVADVCLVCGIIALCVYVLFFYDKLEKKEEPHDAPDADR